MPQILRSKKKSPNPLFKIESTPKRTTKFRRQLVNPDLLNRVAHDWSKCLKVLEAGLIDGQLKGGEFAVLYLLASYNFLFEDQWLMKRKPRGLREVTQAPIIQDWIFSNNGFLSKKFLDRISIIQLFDNFNFCGLRIDAQNLLCGWLERDLPLKIVHEIPAAIEMLKLQAKGQRYISALTAPEYLKSSEWDGRDCLSFFLHDIGHAAQFLFRPKWMQAQIDIFNHLLKLNDDQLLFPPELMNTNWAQEVEYLIGDLNTHPLHYWSVFFGKARSCFNMSGSSQKFESWRKNLYNSWGFSANETNDFELFLNTQDKSAAQRILLKLGVE